MSFYPEEFNDEEKLGGLVNAYTDFDAALLIQDELEEVMIKSAQIHRLEKKAEEYRKLVQPDWGFRHDIPGIYARNPVLAMGNLGVSLANGYYGWRARLTQRKAESLSEQLYEE